MMGESWSSFCKDRGWHADDADETDLRGIHFSNQDGSEQEQLIHTGTIH